MVKLLRKSFSKDIKKALPQQCQNCGTINEPLEDHHIVEVNGIHLLHSNGCFNCIRLCKSCHDKISHSKDNDYQMLKKSLSWWNLQIVTGKYKPTDIDNKCFIELQSIYGD